ncbi:unnamed protein product, partial [Allacma fusca]
ALEHCKL